MHYLPVKADFSNLEETVRYVINPINAEHVASIVKNAQVIHRFRSNSNSNPKTCSHA